MRNGLKIQKNEGQSAELPFTFPEVLQASKAALTKNGYVLLVSMQTDQKAVYVTERKTSTPASLEVFGFRNQYLLILEKQSSEKSKISVNADFEKLSPERNYSCCGKNRTTRNRTSPYPGHSTEVRKRAGSPKDTSKKELTNMVFIRTYFPL